MNRRRFIFAPSIAVLFALLLFAVAARAETAPAPAPAAKPAAAAPITDAYSNQLIRREGTTATTNPAAKDAATTNTPSALQPTRVLLALGGVLAVIFALRWGARRLMPGAAGARSTRAMKVLSRCVIAPRQHLLLVQVGRRLVLVGDGGSQLNPLCEITDAEEISALLAQIRDETGAIASRFDSIFGRARKGFDSKDEPDRLPSDETTAATAPMDESNLTTETPDPSLAATRAELVGLSDKVRGLARQLGRV